MTIPNKDERKKLPSLAEDSKLSLAINSKKRTNTLGLCERVVARCPIVQKKVIKKVPSQEKTPEKKGTKRKEIPKTPDHYWDTGFPTLEEQIRRGNLEIATSPWKSTANSNSHSSLFLTECWTGHDLD